MNAKHSGKVATGRPQRSYAKQSHAASFCLGGLGSLRLRLLGVVDLGAERGKTEAAKRDRKLSKRSASDMSPTAQSAIAESAVVTPRTCVRWPLAKPPVMSQVKAFMHGLLCGKWSVMRTKWVPAWVTSLRVPAGSGRSLGQESSTFIGARTENSRWPAIAEHEAL
jgi:hypothetical protein